MATARVWLTCALSARDSAQAAIDAAGLGDVVQFFSVHEDAPDVYFEGLVADDSVVAQVESVLDSVANTRHWRAWRRPAEIPTCVQESDIYTTYAAPQDEWPTVGSGPGPLQKLTDRAVKAAIYRDLGLGPLAPLRQTGP